MRDSDVLEKNPYISRAALEAIHSQLYGWALSRCDFDNAAAEDLMQQAYVEMLSGSARFDKKSSLKTFVFSVVQNLARNRYRRVLSRLKFARQYEQQTTRDVAYTHEPDVDLNIWKSVQELPSRQRDIIELVFCRELTIEQAATVMGVSTGTGRVHYDRAKKALRRKLQPTREIGE